jgi:hypothetical protein
MHIARLEVVGNELQPRNKDSQIQHQEEETRHTVEQEFKTLASDRLSLDARRGLTNGARF